MATCQIHKVVMDEFGDQSITETLNTGISLSEYIKLKERHALNTEWIGLDEFPWAQRSLGELENTPAVEPHNSDKHSSYSIFDTCCCFPTS